MSRRPSPLDNEQCRQCSSFSDYVKSTKKRVKEESLQNADDNVSLISIICYVFKLCLTEQRRNGTQKDRLPIR